MRKNVCVLCLALLSFVWARAGDVKTEHDPKADFSKYKSFRWIPKSALVRGKLPEGAPSEEVVDRQIQEAVDQELAGKGFRKVESDSDLLVNYLGLVSYRILDWEGARKSHRTGADTPGKPLIPYEEWKPFWEMAQEGLMERRGTLTVDLVDAKTNRLVWRGSVTEILAAVPDPDGGRKIQAAVGELFQSFPPR